LAYDSEGSPFRVYSCEWFKQNKILSINASLFDENGKLKSIDPHEWSDDFATFEDAKRPTEEEEHPF
jgi:hypothetical protein